MSGIVPFPDIRQPSFSGVTGPLADPAFCASENFEPFVVFCSSQPRPRAKALEMHGLRLENATRPDLHYPRGQHALSIALGMIAAPGDTVLTESFTYSGMLALSVQNGYRLHGDTPVTVTRDTDNEIYAFENRCAHRGALICLENRGKHRKDFSCVYHAWNYDPQGNLTGVAFKDGIKGKGGMPDSFKMEQHGPRKLRIATLHGLIFGSFSEDVPSIEEYLGEEILNRIERVLGGRTPVVLGRFTQVLPNNWKLYMENVKQLSVIFPFGGQDDTARATRRLVLHLMQSLNDIAALSHGSQALLCIVARTPPGAGRLGHPIRSSVRIRPIQMSLNGSLLAFRSAKIAPPLTVSLRSQAPDRAVSSAQP